MKIYQFPNGKKESPSADIIGGKGAGLMKMAALGMNIPPGFIIPTSESIKFLDISDPKSYKWDAKTVTMGLNALYKKMGYMPLVSVRSGAPVSMPGMMETVLNVGLTKENMPEWFERIGKRQTYECRARLVRMYGEIVNHIPSAAFDQTLNELFAKTGRTKLGDLLTYQFGNLVDRYELVFERVTGNVFPEDVNYQIQRAAEAVFFSWASDRAGAYRTIHNIDPTMGTAVVVQTMVFGNFNEKSCTGVVFSSNPSTGESGMSGEFLPCAQGEDVVAGLITPVDLSEMQKWNANSYDELEAVVEGLAVVYGDMVDVEFTVQDRMLYILQCRIGKRSARAAFRIAVTMFNNKTITVAEALKRLSVEDFYEAQQNTIHPGSTVKEALTGLAAGGGVVQGKVALTSEKAVAMKKMGERVILVRTETTPDDISGINACEGILTTTGGFTSHAAVVARGMYKACVVGCEKLEIGKLEEGQIITLDGNTGKVWLDDEVEIIRGEIDVYMSEVLKWLKKIQYGDPESTGLVVLRSNSVKTTSELIQIVEDCSTKELELFIDFDCGAYPLIDRDRSLLDMFGDAQAAEDKFTGEFLLNILKVKYLHKVIIRLPRMYKKTLMKTLLKNKKIVIVRTPETVKDLMEGEYFDLTDEFISSIFGTYETFEKFNALLDEDKRVKKAPILLSVNELVAKYL